MPRHKLLMIMASLTLFYPITTLATSPTLTVRISNALPATGTVEVTLFNSEETFLHEIYLQQSGEVSESGEFTANFVGLEEGEYAVVVIHDENGNNAYDSGFLGFGKEGLGYSKNAQPWFGRPDFNDVKLTIDSELTEIEIRLD